MQRKKGRGRSTKKPRREKLKPGDIIAILEAQQYRCALTGWKLTPDNFSIDHVIPCSRGGKDCKSNLQLVHELANGAKGQMMPAEFLKLCRAVVNQDRRNS